MFNIDVKKSFLKIYFMQKAILPDCSISVPTSTCFLRSNSLIQNKIIISFEELIITNYKNYNTITSFLIISTVQ